MCWTNGLMIKVCHAKITALLQSAKELCCALRQTSLNVELALSTPLPHSSAHVAIFVISKHYENLAMQLTRICLHNYIRK